MTKLKEMRYGYVVCVNDEDLIVVSKENLPDDEIVKYVQRACFYAEFTNIMVDIQKREGFCKKFENTQEAFRYFMESEYNCEVVKIGKFEYIAVYQSEQSRNL